MKLCVWASSDDNRLIEKYIQQIKSAIVGLEESLFGYYPVKVTDVKDVTYKIKTNTKPPYAKFAIISGYAVTDERVDDNTNRRIFNYLAGSIRDTIENTIPNSACPSSLIYADAIKFEVWVKIDEIY